MNSRARYTFVALFSLLLLLGFAIPAAATLVSVQPSSLTVNQGQSFSLDVVISDVTDLYAWQLDLGFDPGILQVDSVTEGPFLATGGSTSFIPGTIDNFGGTVSFNADVLDGAGPGVTGGGTLITFDFTAIGTGTSEVSVFNVILLDSNLAGINTDVENGSVTVNQSAVPEPGSLLLLACGLSGLAFGKRKLL